MGYALPLDELTVDEKLDIIDQVWGSLLATPDSMPSPDWHAEVLRQRQEQVENGTAVFEPLDEVIAQLERELG